MSIHPIVGRSTAQGIFLASIARRISVLVLLLLLPSAEAQIIAKWKSGSGDWSEAEKWDIGVVPRNAGATTYVAIIDLPTEDSSVTVTEAIALSGLVNRESLRVDTGGTLTLGGAVTNSGTICASGGTLIILGTTVNSAGGSITAEQGVVEVTQSTLNGGTLSVSDDPASAVRFNGDVTINGAVGCSPAESPSAPTVAIE